MTIPFTRTRLATALAGVALALAAGYVQGAGFALQENSGSGLGNAYAGGAAAAEDAATVWPNPAGMSRIGTRQVAGALNMVIPSMKFSNDGTSIAAGNQPLGGNGGDAGGVNWIPNLYLVMPIDRQWTFGIGVNAPFGLVTEYDSDWMGRFQAIKSDIKTINVNPAFSWKVADGFTIGAGASYQQIEGTFTNNVNYSAALLGAAQTQGIAPGSATYNAIAAATPGLQSFANISADDYSWGWNVGILWEIDRNSRFGAHWRSDIEYTMSGSAAFCNPGQPGCQAMPTLPPTLAPVVGALAAGVNAALLFNTGVTSKVKVPGILNLSYFTAIDPKWDVMIDAQYTHWSVIKDLTFVRTNGSILQSTPENFKDAWRFSLGASYRYDDKWKFRGGIAFDQSPVQDVDRTARLPDSDRFWIAGGAQFKMMPNLVLDFGASYIWVDKNTIAQIAKTPTSIGAYGWLSGNYNNNVIIVSGQATYSF